MPGYRDGTGGITADIKTAFNYHGSKGLQKIYSLVRSTYSASGQPAIFLSINVDFADVAPTEALTPGNGSTNSQWDTAKWDSGKWAGSTEISRVWQGVSGVGMCAAIRMRVQVNGQSFQANAFDIMFQTGGFL